RLGDRPRPRSDLASKIAAFEQAQEHAPEGLLVRKEKARPSVFDEGVIDPLETAREQRKGKGHGFDLDRSESLFLGGKDHDIRGSVANPGRRLISGKTEMVRKTVLWPENPHPRPVSPVGHRAHKKKQDGGESAQEPRKLANQKQLILARTDPAYAQQNRL